MDVIANFTLGSFAAVGGGEKSFALLSRDYKDMQCVVIYEGTDSGNCGDALRKRLPGQTDEPGRVDGVIPGGEECGAYGTDR